MRRGTLAAAVALVLVLVSCAADGGTTTTALLESPVTTSPVTTQSANDEQPVDGELAPDFVLALDGGGEFALSAEQKPVYMIFWAEW